MTDPRTPTSDPVAEPQTEAGRRLLAAECDAAGWVPLGTSFIAPSVPTGYTLSPLWFRDAVIEVEAEARQQARAAFAAQVAALYDDLDRNFSGHFSGHYRLGFHSAVSQTLRLLAASPEPDLEANRLTERSHADGGWTPRQPDERALVEASGDVVGDQGQQLVGSGLVHGGQVDDDLEVGPEAGERLLGHGYNVQHVVSNVNGLPEDWDEMTEGEKRSAYLALASPEPASPEAPGSGLREAAEDDRDRAAESNWAALAAARPDGAEADARTNSCDDEHCIRVYGHTSPHTDSVHEWANDAACNP